MVYGLGHAFGTSPELWAGMQLQYDLPQAGTHRRRRPEIFLRRNLEVNSKKRKRSVYQLFRGRFRDTRSSWESAEDRAWNNMAPVGREFGSPDYDRLMQQDFIDFKSNLSSLIDKCSDAYVDTDDPSDAAFRKQAVNVQIALHELGQDVSVAVAAAVWRHHSKSLMADWMSGAETVASAKKPLFAYCTREPADW